MGEAGTPEGLMCLASLAPATNYGEPPGTSPGLPEAGENDAGEQVLLSPQQEDPP